MLRERDLDEVLLASVRGGEIEGTIDDEGSSGPDDFMEADDNDYQAQAKYGEGMRMMGGAA